MSTAEFVVALVAGISTLLASLAAAVVSVITALRQGAANEKLVEVHEAVNGSRLHALAQERRLAHMEAIAEQWKRTQPPQLPPALPG